MIQLNDWHIVELTNNILIGKVLNHPEIPDNYEFQTTRLIFLDLERNLVADTNRIYKLGPIDPKWNQYRTKNIEDYIV